MSSRTPLILENSWETFGILIAVCGSSSSSSSSSAVVVGSSSSRVVAVVD